MKTDGTNSAAKPRRRRRWFWYFGVISLVLVSWQVVAWLTPVPAPLASAAAVTDRVYEAVYSEDIMKRAAELPKEVNILLVGLDNRIASTDNHADAIHLISIRTKDSIGATIISIPRGTEVNGYGIDKEFAFMANVRALKGRKTFVKAVSKLTRKKIHYYAEVTFSQVMGVLELIGYKDPATALQFLRHRKTYALGDVQRSYNQGKFIKQQMIRRSDMLTGAKGDLLIRMGLGMVDTDLDLETAQALVYVLKNGNALDEEHISQDMRPRVNIARLESGALVPEPDEVGAVVSKLVRKTGDDIDDLGRYNPYPRLRELVARAEKISSPRGVVSALEPVYAQKAWLQVQERPQRREIRDKVEQLLIKAYTELKKGEKAAELRKYMEQEREAFKEVESQNRRFSYGRRNVPHKSEKLDPVAAQRARQDDIRQKQTHIEPQPAEAATEHSVESSTAPVENTPAEDARETDQPKQEAPKNEAPKQEKPKETPADGGPQVHDIKPNGGE